MINWKRYLSIIFIFTFLFIGLAKAEDKGKELTTKTENKGKELTTQSFEGIDYSAPEFQKKLLNYAKKLSKEHADRFSYVVVQYFDGRMKPFDTLSLEVVNKLHGRSNVFGLTHNQTVLGIYLTPVIWYYIKWIKVKHPAIKILLGVNPKDKYIAFVDVYDKQGNYKLNQAVAVARSKNPAERTEFDKEVLKLDEKIYIFYMIASGQMMRIFPKKDDPNHRWYSAKEALKVFPPDQKKEVEQIILIYAAGVEKGFKKGDWTLANKGVEAIRKFQKKYGKEVMPSDTKIKAEILYNRLMIFERLPILYGLIGFLSIVVIFLRIFFPEKSFNRIKNILVILLFIAFIIHTIGLALRWYVAGHAPWTDAYESMLFISWAVALAGVVFARKSIFVLAAVGIFAAVFLFSAHLGWLNPQITTVVPVLKSYWLLIHVSVLTASYGFLGLSAILGLMMLILFAIRYEKLLGKKRVERIENGIQEALKINELSMIIGLSLLIIGNFLGAIWANESWGRYWGWDPKETWTAVSIAVYAAIVHLKYVKGWYSPLKMAIFSVLGYFSIIMTYFGVNYYLTGLHSYAAGDPFPIPTWVYWALAFLSILIALAILNEYLHKKSNNQNLAVN